MTRVPPFQPYRNFTTTEKQAIAADKRHSGVLALLYGVTPLKIRSIRMELSKRGKV